MMRSGTVFQLPPSAPRIRGIESGLLPTPQTQYDGRSEDAWRAAKERADRKRRSGQYAKGCGTPSMVDLKRAIGGTPNPAFVEWMMGFPEGWTEIEFLGTRSSQELSNVLAKPSLQQGDE